MISPDVNRLFITGMWMYSQLDIFLFSKKEMGEKNKYTKMINIQKRPKKYFEKMPRTLLVTCTFPNMKLSVEPCGDRVLTGHRELTTCKAIKHINSKLA